MYQLKKEKRIINYYTSNLQKRVWIVTFLHNLLGNFIEAAFQFLRSFHKANKINWCFNAKIIIKDVTRKVVIHVIIEIQFSPHSQKNSCCLLYSTSSKIKRQRKEMWLRVYHKMLTPCGMTNQFNSKFLTISQGYAQYIKFFSGSYQFDAAHTCWDGPRLKEKS